MSAESVFASNRGQAVRSTDPGDASVAIAVLSWAWAAVAVDTTPQGGDWTTGRWLARHRSDASLATRLAGRLS